MNKGSATYVPSIFSFTIPPTKHQIEQLLARWQAAKRKCKDEPKVPHTEVAEFKTDTLEDVDSTVVTDGSRSIACPTN